MREPVNGTNGVAIAVKASEVRRVAQALFHQAPDWVTFFREILGVNGVVRTVFLEQDELALFELTDEYGEIQQMLAHLRGRVQTQRPDEPTRVITVRLPLSLHESLSDEAHALRTSVNKLCISKLLQMVDEDLVPNAKGPTAQPPAPQRRPQTGPRA